MSDSGDTLNVVIVGLGYVGVTAAACLVSQGHRVVGVDVSDHKVAAIAAGRTPIEEIGVPEMVEEGVRAGLLSASTHLPELAEVDLVIVCVGTPSAVDGSHNMSFIAESARQIAMACIERGGRSITVAFRSTFRPGTMDELIAPIFAEHVGENYRDSVELIYNPEFLRESTAVADFFAPPKIVIGTETGQPSAVMSRLHAGIDAPTFEVGFREAEITKFIDNSWHAVKVAFANEVGRVCVAYGVDATVAHQVFVADRKLNISPYYLRPGGAFGGSCLPKDVRAMQYIAAAADVRVDLIGSLLETNEAHKAFQLERVLTLLPPGGRVLVAGLAFKAATDDMRESPNVQLVAELLKRGHQVRVYDPAVRTAALVGQNFGYVLSQLPSLRDLLIDESELRSEDYDLVVVNNATGDGLERLGLPLVDLSVMKA